MMQVLEFVFSGFWTFVGCLILFGIACECVAQIVRAIFGRRGE